MAQYPAAARSEVPDRPLTVDLARRHVEAKALSACDVGAVGLELEGHLVDLADPGIRPRYVDIRRAMDNVPALPGGSLLTMEPGGQLELSGPPAPDLVVAVSRLRQDAQALTAALRERNWGLAWLGCDPARPPARVSPASRYDAMATHFAGRGHAAAGAAMMCSSASLQLNVEAGAEPGWADRVRQAYRLGPVLVAMSACSPWLDGALTGWRSSRQRIWTELDPGRCGRPPDTGRPSADWAEFALAAPVMLVRDPAVGADDSAPVCTAVTAAVPFARWAAGEKRLGGRLPTVADLDYHLTTLFPPVRLRGFLEVRYLDATPAAYWPGIAALAATLMDDPVAVDLSAEAAEPVAGDWVTAARVGLLDPGLRRAADRLVQIALSHAPGVTAPTIEAVAALVSAGRSPGDDVADRAARSGALHTLREYAMEPAR